MGNKIILKKIGFLKRFVFLSRTKQIKTMLPKDKLFQDVKTLVRPARQKAYRAIDAERVSTYHLPLTTTLPPNTTSPTVQYTPYTPGA